MKRLAWWAGPAMINGILWVAVVIPHQHRLQAAQEASTLTTIQPRLEALVKESRETLLRETASDAMGEDRSAPMTLVRNLAQRHRLEIAELRVQGSRAAPAAKRRGAEPAAQASAERTIPVDVELVGPFHRLARFISDLEATTTLQMESWTLGGYEEATRSSRLKAQLIVLGS